MFHSDSRQQQQQNSMEIEHLSIWSSPGDQVFAMKASVMLEIKQKN